MAGEKIDLTPEQDGGVIKEIIQEGTSDEVPQKGTEVSVHYVGTLESDGSKFDSSRDRDDQFKFTLGKGSVIKAWELCVASMKKGELCKVTCQSDYAYGDTGSPPKIPAKATLVFEIELFNWTYEDLTDTNDGGITRKLLKEGSGYLSPGEDTFVEISLIGRCGAVVFDERTDVAFCLGEGSEYDVPVGIETALMKFKKDEKSVITLLPQYAFGKEGSAKFKIDADATVEYEIVLLNFERPKEEWQMDDEEKLNQAKMFKERGTKYFKEEKYALALGLYLKVAKFAKGSDSSSAEATGELIKEQNTVALAGHLNASMCHIKLLHYSLAKEQAEEAVKIDENNTKACFRLGQALLGMNEPESALKSFKKSLQIEPTNAAASRQIEVCKAAIEKQKTLEKSLYSKMFK